MKISRPRFGSLQFWPRKRADRFLPSVNWGAIKGEGFLGFIAYKAGMATAIVKDATPKSMTMGKKIAIPVTFLEFPSMKIYSVRFYKNGIPMTEVVVSNDKELKKIVKTSKNISTDLDSVKDYDDVRAIVYSIPKETNIKKTPDMIEVGIGGKDKINFVKNFVGKNITLADVLKGDLLDARGLTKGKGLSGPVSRFGIGLKQHKSEKGVRKPGSLGPWHPARVIFRVPLSGQLGMFSRVHYNLKVLGSNNTLKDKIKLKPFRHYGDIKTNYIIVNGSVQGPVKRQVLMTLPLRPSLKQTRKKLEMVEAHI